MPGLAFEIDDLCQSREPTARFDALLDRGCLHAIPRSDRARYMRNVAEMARPRAAFLLLSPVPGGSSRREVARQIEALAPGAFAVERVELTVMAGSPSAGNARRGMVLWARKL